MNENPAVEDQSISLGFQNVYICAIVTSSISFCEVIITDCSNAVYMTRSDHNGVAIKDNFTDRLNVARFNKGNFFMCLIK